MSITYDLDCGDETITLELLDDGTLISYGFDIESEMIAKEMGFEPHPCFAAMDKALWKAARGGDIDIVEILLAAGADVRTWDDQPLRYAAVNGYADIVKLLLEYGADIHVYRDSALRIAAIKGYFEIVKILLEYGADANNGSLIAAAGHNNADIVKLLLEYGADIHKKNDYALFWARENGHTDIVAILEDWIRDHG